MGPAIIAIAGQALLSVGVATAVGYVTSRIRGSGSRVNEPKQDRQRAPTDTASNGDPLSVEAAPDGPCIGLFGRRRVGGRITFSGLDSAGKRHLNIVLASAQVTAIDGLYIDNVPVTLDAQGYVTTSPWNNLAVQVKFYTGSQTSRDSVLGAAFAQWSTRHVGFRTAYARITINSKVTTAPAEIPDFTFLVRGFKCYDPRNTSQNVAQPSTWSYSDNPAVIAANYLLHELGKGGDTSSNDIDWYSFRVAANVCDEQVSLRLGDATEDRYACSVRWQTDEPHESVLDRIGAAMGGSVYPVGGKWRCIAAQYDAPAETWTPDCYVGAGIEWPDTVPNAERINGVRGTFSSPAHAYEMRDFPVYQSAAALAADGGREKWLDLELSTVNSHSQAQRLAKIAFNKARSGIRVSVSTKFENFDTVAGDVIALTDDFAGYVDKPFRVVEDRASGLELTFELQAESSSFYNWDEVAEEKPFIAERPIADGQGGSTGSGWTATFDSTPTLESGAVVYAITSGANRLLKIGFWELATSDYRHEYQYDFPGISGGAVPSAVLTSSKGAADVTLVTVAPTASDPRFHVRHRTVRTSTGEATPWRILVGGSPVTSNPAYFVHINTIDDYTDANSPYYYLPAARYPSVSNGVNGGIVLAVPHVDSPRALTIEVLVSGTNDSSTAVLLGSATNATTGASFAYARSPNNTRYFWARAANGAKKGPLSNAVAVTFN